MPLTKVTRSGRLSLSVMPEQPDIAGMLAKNQTKKAAIPSTGAFSISIQLVKPGLFGIHELLLSRLVVNMLFISPTNTHRLYLVAVSVILGVDQRCRGV